MFALFSLSLSLNAQTSTTNVIVLNGSTITTITTVSPGTNIVIPNSTQVSTTNATTAALTNLLKSAGISTNVQKITSSLVNNFIDATPYFKNQIINLDGAYLYNPSQHTMGYFFGADIPIGSQGSLGAGALHLGKQWDAMPISLKLGITINYPWIGKVYNYIGSGSIYDVTDSKFGTYSVLGGVRTWELGKRWNISLGFGVSDISTYKGLDIDGVIRLNWHF
jgi:hypothetical protein